MKRIICIFLFGGLLALSLPALGQQGPEIPAGFPQPLEVRFAKNKKIPVYSGPGERYIRPGKGKAAVSTNDWIQVFGREGGWLLIHYGISGEQMRFGYISASELPKGASVPELTWGLTDTVTAQKTSMTDDPLGNWVQTAVLEEGVPVKHLGVMGDWAYVELSLDAGKTRGFVFDSALIRQEPQESAVPPDLRATSWGRLDRDYATTRYYLDPEIGRYQGQWDTLPNAWLRLDSLDNMESLERIRSFAVVSGRASCVPFPVPLLVAGMEDWENVYFMDKGSYRRGALEIKLQEGEKIDNVTLVCRWENKGRGIQELTIPLAGVPEDTAYPAGTATFSMLRCSHLEFTDEQLQNLGRGTGSAATLGAVLEDAWQPMPEAPPEVLALPYETSGYSFYALQGHISRQPGDYGLYDLTFSLEDPPQGVYLTEYRPCDSCSEIDTLDMPGGEVYLQGEGGPVKIAEMLERNFTLLLHRKVEYQLRTAPGHHRHRPQKPGKSAHGKPGHDAKPSVRDP